jgi:UDP-2,3-diacylglucosamine pyrophosphatase LpxH
MVAVRRAFVLSDLHLGPGGPLTTFHEADRLAGLLEHWRQTEPNMELVLAGDVFDFLQGAGYDGFSAAKAADRFDEIARNPATAAVLTALRGLAGRAGIELTVLSGNHDPELLVDDVRDAFAERIGRTRGAIRWADDEALVPRDGEHPPVWGRAIAPSDAASDPSRSVWVVHGDRWDPSNHIDRDAVRAAIAAGQGEQVALPIGSHLVFEVLSRLKVHHRWVDELKPELPVVLPLLLAVEPRLTMAYLARHRSIAAPLVVSRLKAWRRKGPLFDAGTAPAPGALGAELSALDPAEALIRSLGTELAGVPSADVDRLLAALEVHLERGAPAAGKNLMAGPSGVFGFLLRAWLRVVRATDRFGRIDGDDSTAPDAKRYLPPGLGALVAGHTHGARIRADLEPPYFNSGTWVPVRTVPAGDLAAWLDEVTEPTAPRAPSPGTFVRIEVGDGPPRVAVEEWPPKAPP